MFVSVGVAVVVAQRLFFFSKTKSKVVEEGSFSFLKTFNLDASDVCTVAVCATYHIINLVRYTPHAMNREPADTGTYSVWWLMWSLLWVVAT